MEISNQMFNSILDLYLLDCFKNRSFSFYEFEMKILKRKDHNFRKVLKEFVELGILKVSDNENKNYRWDRYNIDYEELLRYIKEIIEFQKIYIVIRDNVTDLLPELYEKEEVKELEFKFKKN